MASDISSDVDLEHKLAGKLLKKNLEAPFSNDDSRFCLATLTGLEPATSAVTGRRANQLRHRALV